MVKKKYNKIYTSPVNTLVSYTRTHTRTRTYDMSIYLQYMDACYIRAQAWMWSHFCVHDVVQYLGYKIYMYKLINLMTLTCCIAFSQVCIQYMSLSLSLFSLPHCLAQYWTNSVRILFDAIRLHIFRFGVIKINKLVFSLNFNLYNTCIQHIGTGMLLCWLYFGATIIIAAVRLFIYHKSFNK